ncbi:retinal-specific phospholipid-transporting ATPase ABCA4-like [Macrosteles quadrilineatus]|uniref:retinal-specific phospholipid-transporting ATPase ABCA4-like n=1 Tax=Macrosteles quadrilineatus TaxID=74068 RepID=UPI0023E28105|nr:retinal-specific phospholipid-transporting ATPase ABCA4-like [Macrosteles quadrilineatus]
MNTSGKATMGRVFMVLLWKVYVLRKRRYLITLLELVVPIFLFWFLIRINNAIPKQDDQISYSPWQKYKPYSDFVNGNFKIAYTPSTAITDEYMSIVISKIRGEVTIVKKDSEDEVVDWLRQSYINETLQFNSSEGYVSHTPGVGVIFNLDNPKSFTYTLRTSTGDLQTSQDSLYGDKYNGYSSYYESGFLGFQSGLDRAYLSKNNINATLYNVVIDGLPEKSTFDFLQILLPIFIMVCFNFTKPSLLRGIIEEKSSGIKELMLIMGLKSCVNWVGWMIYALTVYIPVTLVIAWMMTTDFGAGPVVDANVVAVWVLFLLFALGFIMLIFAISTFFTNGTLAIVSALILWWVVSVLMLVYFFNTPDQYPLWLNLVFCLWPSAGLQWSLNTIKNFNKNGHTWTLADLFDDGAGGGRVSVGLAALMFLVQIVLYTFITWYMDNVKPGPYGRAKSLLFIFQCFKKNDYDSNSSQARRNQRNYEEPPNGVKIGIKIQNLRKTFNNKVFAVKNVDLDIYEGNITALLGHNGAGKTTTMSMIAGFFSPSGGQVIVKGRNIFDNMDDFRSNLGICPQHNLLFQFFTVLEHLVFFGMLKGLPNSKAERDGLQLLRTFKIDAKKNDLVSKLSGGMKRKLCLCIALMGDPEILMLDEPTSGLDPESRRQVWDILLGFREQRTTIITTHFMEEADVLGDRIAIMDHGQVSCYGTTMFLKKLYGTGYHLNISKLETAQVSPITRVIEQYVTSASMKVSSPSQLSFNIKSNESPQFPALFSALDSWRMELGLTAVSISCTTMEDVFLRVAEEEPDNQMESNVQTNGGQAHKYKKLSGLGLMWQQLKALVVKRMLARLRSWISTLIVIIIPVLLTALTIRMTMKTNHSPVQPSLRISLNSFPQVHVAASSESPAIGSALQQIVTSGGGVYEAIPNNVDFNDYLIQQIKKNLVQYERQMIAAFKYNSSTFYGGYGSMFVHSSSLVLNMIANTLLQVNNASSSITTYNHPIVIENGENVCDLANSSVLLIMQFPSYVILLSLGLLVVTMSFISFPLNERVSNSKQLQLMSGVSPLLYWMVNVVSDYIIYLITMLLCIAMVCVFQKMDIYTSSGYMGTLIGVFALYGISGITFAHFFSFLVSSSIKASAIFTVLNLITGVFAAVFLIIYGLINSDFEIYRYILSFNPAFAMTFALSNLLSAMYIDGTCNQCGSTCNSVDPLQYYQAGKERGNGPFIFNLGVLDSIIFLAVDAVLYFLVVMIIEYGVMKKLWFFISKLWIKMDYEMLEEDSDVRIEKERVLSSMSVRGYTQNTSVLCVSGLGKKYNRKSTAVHGVSFQVGLGDCFGLLGVNGAGKTTTFKMLTGEEVPSKGDANVHQFRLSRQKSKFLSLIGYCPQFDAINPMLTGREMLIVYARLRGIPSSQQNYEVSKWIQMMGLKDYADRPCGTFSGGNKRKLSTAIAFIGSPPVVFLDEPTSGVDPVSRRRLWDIVAECQKTGQAIVLTSHSMEECEALCSRLTIMVAGQMKCIGSTQYLKQKFGQGHTIKIKLFSSSRIENAVTRLKLDMANRFRECSVKDEHWGLLHYHIKDPSVRLSELFTKMEYLKRTHDIIEDYVVSDTTLEQVFMSFAQQSSTTSTS